MKFLKWFLIIIGIVAALVAVGMIVYGVYHLQLLLSAVRSYSAGSSNNPTQEFVVGSLILAVGSFLLGLGLGLPRWTKGSLEDKWEEEQAASDAPQTTSSASTPASDAEVSDSNDK